MPLVILNISIIAALVLINGLLAMAEIAIVASRPARLEARAAAGSRGARMALALREDATRFLSTIQVGITLVGVLAGAFGGATLAGPLGDEFNRAGFIAPYGRALAFAVVVGAITYLSLVIGELGPKRIALQHPERIASVLAPVVRLLALAVAPAAGVLTVSTEALLRLLRVRAATEAAVTEDEIRILVEQGSAAGILEAGERDVIHRALTLADRTAGSLMTPRTRITALDLADPPEQLWQTIRKSGYSYLPVYREDLDNLLGVAATRDLLLLDPGPRLPGQVAAIMHPAEFVPEGVSAVVLLEHFKRSGQPLAVVVDEYGGVQGVVTVTDVLEALVGDIGPAELDEPAIVERADGSLLVDGLLPVGDLKERLAIERLPGEGQFQTVAGFVLFELGHIPVAGERLTFGDWCVEVVDMDGARIDKLIFSPREGEASSSEDP